MKKNYWVGILLIVAFAGLAFQSFHKALTPYVSVSEAKTSKDAVQVAGDLMKETIHYDIRAGELRFSIKDKTGVLPVVYRGEQPGNFQQATRVVVSGNYDRDEKALIPTKLLVKCPSKYQGTETTQ